MTAPIVVEFDHELASRHSLVGGKGANLGKLSQAGFRVPPGFTVTVNGYGTFLQGTGLEDTIAACIATLPEGDPDKLEEQTAALRATIVGTPMPDSVVAAVTRAYRELGDDRYVAVRSSGTAEDLADASFAGLHDTILGVKGIDEVLTAVKACWASMWSARATSYRKTKGFVHAEASIAVRKPRANATRPAASASPAPTNPSTISGASSTARCSAGGGSTRSSTTRESIRSSDPW